MSTIRAVVVDPATPGRLALREVTAPRPRDHEALVRVQATSLNRGDLLAAQAADPGWCPGHDIAGTVVAAAADGSGPGVGARVVGLLDSGAWAEQVAAATDRLAVLPDAVGLADASTLPTAGLTAHRAVERGGSLLGARVLVTGSTGGVGLFAHQLASRSGAFVVGTARRPDREPDVRALGADEVVVGDDLRAARDHGPYDLVVESLGGEALAAALSMLTPGGVCVSLGWSASPTVEFDLREFLAVGGSSLYGLRMYHELAVRPASTDLALLAGMLADGTLRTTVAVDEDWTDIARVATGLLGRTFVGKAVLRLT